MKFKLLLFFALNILFGFTSSIIINNEAKVAEQTKGISNYFPEVIYPTSLFEVNEPFYYTSHSHDVLEAFPDYVKNAYKSLRTSSIPKNTGKNLEDNLLIDIAKCCAAVNNHTNYMVAKTDKMCEDNTQNFTLVELVGDNDEQNNYDENNTGQLLKVDQMIPSTNDTMTPSIDDYQNYSGLPVQLITEKEVLKNDTDLFTNVPIETLILADHLNLFNISMSEKEQGIITKSFIEEDKLSNINTFEEFDEIYFENILPELMCDYLNNAQDLTSEFMNLQLEIEEIFDPDSNESTYSSINEDSIQTVNNGSFSIPVDCRTINCPIGIIINETVSTENERQFIYKDKALNEGNDSFLELIISLNQRLQNNDFQNINDYEEQVNSTEP